MSIIDSFRLDGYTALVTGAKRGIGKAITLALADAGADIVGVSATLEEGSEVQREVEAMGRSFKAYKCDFSQRQQTIAFAETLKAEVPAIDIFFSNAGTITRAPAIEHPDDAWDRVLEVNLSSHFILAREVAKGMVEKGWGKIVFTASMMTFHGGHLIPSYTASKGAIGQLTKALANEWAGLGVHVNAIAPGYIATELNPELRSNPVTNKFIVDRISSGRWGTPDDLKGAAVFLASHASDYVDGVVFPIDGGWLAK